MFFDERNSCVIKKMFVPVCSKVSLSRDVQAHWKSWKWGPKKYSNNNGSKNSANWRCFLLLPVKGCSKGHLKFFSAFTTPSTRPETSSLPNKNVIESKSFTFRRRLDNKKFVKFVDYFCILRIRKQRWAEGHNEFLFLFLFLFLPLAA